MATIRQYLADANVPVNLPGIDFRPLQAGAEIGRALERGGKEMAEVSLQAGNRFAAVEEEKRKAKVQTNALERFSAFTQDIDMMESALQRANLPSEQYVGTWVAAYQKTKQQHLKGITDPDEMAAVLRHLYPFESSRYGQARGYADKRWGQELEAQTENSIAFYEKSARQAAEVGAPFDWVTKYMEVTDYIVDDAGIAYAPDKAAATKLKARERIAASYLQSKVETDPGKFIADHIRGRHEDIRNLVTAKDYWTAMERAHTLDKRIDDALDKRRKNTSEEISKRLKLRIINGEDVETATLNQLSDFMTESDLTQVDAFKRTYEEYRGKGVKTDQATFDELNARIIRDEMTEEGGLLPYSKKLSKEDFNTLYSRILQRQKEREQEDKPHGRLVKAGRDYISRIFARSNNDLNYDRVVDQVAAEAILYYDEAMARDKDKKLDPTDIAKESASRFAPLVGSRLKYGTKLLAPALRFHTEAEATDAYRRGKMERNEYNMHMRIFKRLRALTVNPQE